MFTDRDDIYLSISESNALDYIIRQYNDHYGPSVIEAYQDGIIDKEHLIEVVKVMETNGYSKSQIYDLPYEFALRITGGK